MSISKSRVDIDSPQLDQSLYWNRARHFFTVTNPLNLFKTNAELEHAKDVVTKYRNNEDIPGLTTEELWHQKHIYDSAHHPQTGERQIIFGRMSAQVPANMVVTGCMLSFYKTTPQVVFWQWFNQSFNAVVNYTNRSGAAPIPQSQLAISYVMATGAAMGSALGLNHLATKAPPLLGRFVPFCAVSVANCVNIPLMRKQELTHGITIVDENGNKIGKSKIAAKSAISMVAFSRIAMCFPGMILPPILMNNLEKKGVLKRMPWINAPLQMGLCGLFLIFMTPMSCALFPQMTPIAISSLEPELQEVVKNMKHPVTTGYYQKGL